MKRLVFGTLLLAGLTTAAFAVQQANNSAQAASSLDRPTEPNFVFDDDGGKAQIVPADFSVAGEKKFHGGAVLKSAQQVSIFLGSGWAEQQIPGRQSCLVAVTS